ncbi:hypothetical protein [Lactobacillus plantarum JDM1] [Lactiplantibacillus mudanjiangensis]|uniref:hypothetical protein n=1 Tax=Lactiplantibacillus mudanjiangensis TaxID=1296538 RepID=UPI001014C3F4|nr:hypothetical protein [Lactobacillus plantarum JDM1] [Lactiplantibacillus mudanjiangensis]
MATYEFVAMDEPKVIESSVSITDNHDGTFMLTATKSFPRKNDQVVTMKFTKNGLAAISGLLMMLVGDGDE